jgi:transposase
LEELELTYSMVPAIEIMRSIGLTRGKSDKIDSQRIAEYAYRFQDKLLETKLPPAYLMRIARLFTFRKQRVKRTTALKNQIKQLEGAWQCSPRDYMLKTAKQELKQTQKVIKEVERQLMELIMESEARENYELSRSVSGVGPMIACYLLICTENYKLFRDARKFASYAGIAPFEHSSGTSIKGRTRTSIHRNEQIKTLMLNGVNAMIGRDNEYGIYYRRKIEEGKHKKVVKNAVANKMLGRVFAVIKRQTPYVATYAQNF